VVETKDEDATQAKDVANKPRLQNKADSFCIYVGLCAEARMCATLTVKKFKIQSWENFRHELDSNYWQAIRSVGCKQLHNLLLDPTKTKLVFCSAISSISLADGKYFKDLLNQITITPSDKHEKHLGMKTPLLQPGASWRSKHWRPVKLH